MVTANKILTCKAESSYFRLSNLWCQRMFMQIFAFASKSFSFFIFCSADLLLCVGCWHPTRINSLNLKPSKSCDVTHTFCLTPLGVGGSPTLGWYSREREWADFLFFFKRETCWTSFFPCHGLATTGGEQCNQPPWENIVVRPPLMMVDWIWRYARDSQRTEGRFAC